MRKLQAMQTGISAPLVAGGNHVALMTRRAQCAFSPRVKLPRAILVDASSRQPSCNLHMKHRAHGDGFHTLSIRRR
jgi:hypothetical protein